MPKSAHQIGPSVSGVSRPKQDFLEGPGDSHFNPITPRKLWMVRFWSPMPATARSFTGPSEGGTKHDGIRP